MNSNVINSVRKIGVKSYVYVGTACSFPKHLQDSSTLGLLQESHQYPANPESAYGWSKLMGEYEAFLLEKECKVPVSVLSLHNVYGAPCDFSELRSQVIPSLIRKALNYPHNDFIVWGSGNQKRAFVHVDDVVKALITTLDKGMGKGLIQIGPDKATSIKDTAEIIKNLVNPNIPLIFDHTKPEGDHSRAADYSKARDILGWSPSVELNIGIEQVIKWISKNNIL
jgi:GDP-D-mannose 3', 5'-epimerase